jgi:ABC-type dipeptide/oligopeptide/nickel transport system permease subunit
MSFYRWCLRSGAAILFAISVAQLVLGLASAMTAAGTSIGRSADGAHDLTGTVIWLEMVMAVVTSAAFPFFGAVLIDRLDRRIVERKAEPSE